MKENRSYPEQRSDNFTPKRWVGRNLTKPNKGKCQVLCLGLSNPLKEERWELAGFRAAWQGRTRGSWWRTDWPWTSSVSLQLYPGP